MGITMQRAELANGTTIHLKNDCEMNQTAGAQGRPGQFVRRLGLGMEKVT